MSYIAWALDRDCSQITSSGSSRVCGYNAPMRRILLVKTSSLGDVVHNLPVV